MANNVGIDITQKLKDDLENSLGCGSGVETTPREIVQMHGEEVADKSNQDAGASKTTPTKDFRLEVTMLSAASDQKEKKKLTDNHSRPLGATPQQICEENLEKDGTLYNSALCAYARIGALEEALNLLSNMETAEIAVYPEAIGEVATACTNAGKHDDALLLQDQQKLLLAIHAESLLKDTINTNMA
eukprot:CAMPEP_0169061340 /NCGR_PEP_ID=MMETSP1015-20121227/55_1 /TAXON_ID=342587 /ORGANISM="Karlodinium micrum, Strain CCMP2283" /LENGTH=186 /DNA_ID=CAMNT_0009119315 /DNA_START=35 /DNA_END=595 /DNA_ORIENTATION=-